jgi:rRNA maturation protein Nop10
LKAELRRSKRSAAPFSKGKAKADKKKPGRRAGQGPFTRRTTPEVKPTDQVEEIAVNLDDTRCPECGGQMGVSTEEASIIDAPAEPVRVIKLFTVQVGVCPRCGRKVRAAHPDLAANQFGATAHRVGPNVRAQALALHYHSGLSLSKVPAAITTSCGIGLTQGGLTQQAGKLCAGQGPVGMAYQELREQIREEPVVNTDDTGWRTGGVASFLMGFFTAQMAVYQIRHHHRHEEVLEMLGPDFQGLLGTDRGTSYEARELAGLAQQKCLSHLLQNLSKVEETKTGRTRWFCRDLKATLREALDLWKIYESGGMEFREYRERGEKIESKLTAQLRHRRLRDADNQRLLDGIGRQHDCGRVLLFLLDPAIEPTNNRAERGLRPAVIARKVSQCSKNEKGAATFEAMKSVVATLALRGHNVVKGLAAIIRGEPMPGVR